MRLAISPVLSIVLAKLSAKSENEANAEISAVRHDVVDSETGEWYA